MVQQRRDKGEGSIFQRSGSKKWIAKLNIDGKAVTRTADSKSEAKQKLKELQKLAADQERRSTKNFSEIRADEYFDLFLEYKKKTLSNVSYRRLESTVNTHIKPHVDCISMEDLDEHTIQEKLEEAFQSGLSYSSVKKIYEAYKGCFKFAADIKRDILPYENVMLAVTMIPEKKFKNKSSEPRFLHSEEGNNERERFLTEALRRYKNGKLVYRYGAPLVFMMYTGIREGEMCGLGVKNVFEEEKYIYICDTAETIKDKKGKWITHIRANETKYTSEREVPLNKRAMEALALIKETFPPVEDTDRIIYSVNKKVLPPQELNKTFNRICAAANIENMEGVGPHCLRHTFATALFEKDVDIKTISELLGHSSVGITQDIYISVTKHMKRKAVIDF